MCSSSLAASCGLRGCQFADWTGIKRWRSEFDPHRYDASNSSRILSLRTSLQCLFVTKSRLKTISINYFLTVYLLYKGDWYSHRFETDRRGSSAKHRACPTIAGHSARIVGTISCSPETPAAASRSSAVNGTEQWSYLFRAACLHRHERYPGPMGARPRTAGCRLS